MASRITPFLLAGFMALGAVSCKKSSKDDAAAKIDTFRKQQRARAVKSYQELVKKYPDSEYAEKAKERIRALAPPSTPKK